MKYAAFFVAIILIVAQPLGSHAQEAEIAALTKGTWIVDSVRVDPYWKDSNTGPVEGYYQFYRAEMSCFSFPSMPTVVNNRWGYVEDAITDQCVLVRNSCSDYIGFLGEGKEGRYYLGVCGEHWPYIARFDMTSDSTFTFTSDATEFGFAIKYFRRIQTPEFLKR